MKKGIVPRQTPPQNDDSDDSDDEKYVVEWMQSYRKGLRDWQRKERREEMDLSSGDDEPEEEQLASSLVDDIHQDTGTLRLYGDSTPAFTLEEQKVLRAHPIVTQGGSMRELCVKLYKINGGIHEEVAQKRLTREYSPTDLQFNVSLSSSNAGHRIAGARDVKLEILTPEASVIMHHHHNLSYDRARRTLWYLRLLPVITNGPFGESRLKWVTNLHPRLNESSHEPPTKRMKYRHCHLPLQNPAPSASLPTHEQARAVAGAAHALGAAAAAAAGAGMRAAAHSAPKHSIK